MRCSTHTSSTTLHFSGDTHISPRTRFTETASASTPAAAQQGAPAPGPCAPSATSTIPPSTIPTSLSRSRSRDPTTPIDATAGAVAQWPYTPVGCGCVPAAGGTAVGLPATRRHAAPRSSVPAHRVHTGSQRFSVGRRLGAPWAVRNRNDCCMGGGAGRTGGDRGVAAAVL